MGSSASSGPWPREVDRLAEVDRPLRRQRHDAERAQPREGRGQREVGQAEGLPHPVGLGHDRVDLLRPDHGAGDDRAPGAQGDAHEAPAAEPGQLVALPEVLAHSLHALREDAEELALPQEALRVLGVGADGARLREHRGEHGQQREHVEGQHPADPLRRVLVADGQLDHQPVVGQHPRVVGDDQPRPVGRHVLGARGLHPPPHRVQELEDGLEGLREAPVRAELVRLLGVPGEVERPLQPGEARPAEPPRARVDHPGQGHEQALVLLGGVRRRQLPLELGQPPTQRLLVGRRRAAPPRAARRRSRAACPTGPEMGTTFAPLFMPAPPAPPPPRARAPAAPSPGGRCPGSGTRDRP